MCDQQFNMRCFFIPKYFLYKYASTRSLQSALNKQLNRIETQALRAENGTEVKGKTDEKLKNVEHKRT